MLSLFPTTSIGSNSNFFQNIVVVSSTKARCVNICRGAKWEGCHPKDVSIWHFVTFSIAVCNIL